MRCFASSRSGSATSSTARRALTRLCMSHTHRENAAPGPLSFAALRTRDAVELTAGARRSFAVADAEASAMSAASSLAPGRMARKLLRQCSHAKNCVM